MPLTNSGALRAAAADAMRHHGFRPDFPTAVTREIDAIDDSPAEAIADGAVDLRNLPWSSIDERDTRHLDQVEVAERISHDTIRIRIAVADVEHLVPRGSPADEHAAINTTSVYAGVAVFPMFPDRLASHLSSLNEGEDRIALVIEFDVAPDGALAGTRVYRALVRNSAKLAYNEVGAWFDGAAPAPNAIARRSELLDQMSIQREAAERLRAARVLAGAVNFDAIEAMPVVARGRVVDLTVARRNGARDLIEDLMVAANRAVAAYLVSRGSVSLRRVVREPKRWDRIVALAAEVGDSLPHMPDNHALAAFLDRRREEDPDHFDDLAFSIVKLLGPGEYILERRTGDRAHEGHFAVGDIADYVHSTAPNRRYADLVTQRMLRAAAGETPPPYTDEELIRIARHCTERVDAARRVERSVRKMAGAAMLADRVGDSFSAIVTAASPKGVYARVLNPPVEGRIMRGAQGLDVGDTVRLVLIAADAERGHIDFAHGAEEETARKRERSRRKKIAADRLRRHIGETFDAVVSAVTPQGTWARLSDDSAEGRVVRGFRTLTAGMHVRVKLVDADSVHGFIDFEYEEGVAASKRERLERKRAAARELRAHVGEHYRARVTGTSPKATWLTLVGTGAEGRLVRGRSGLNVDDEIGVVLLGADPVRGFIDFAREDQG